METLKKLSVEEAAQILGRTPNAVRIQMSRGILPIGKVEPCLTGNGQRQNYVIYEHLLKRYLEVG